MRQINNQFKQEQTIKLHRKLLGHNGCGVTELRIFKPKPMVAYTDNDDSTVKLVLEINSPGIYIGVQPRPLWLFDKAPNCWKPAYSNCACDRDIEFITAVFFDIDVIRDKRYPANNNELKKSLLAAKTLTNENELTDNATICCSGNGHYVMNPIVPIEIDCHDIGKRFKQFCNQKAETIKSFEGIKADPVYNLSRVMRLMGTVNGKGVEIDRRIHRRACFTSEPVLERSAALYHIILNTELPSPPNPDHKRKCIVRCNINETKKCEFIKWCTNHPMNVTEPLWFAMITNLANLQDGPQVIHEISMLDMFRYDYQKTQNMIDRVIRSEYFPLSCEKIKSYGFSCPNLGRCKAKAPMHFNLIFYHIENYDS